MSYSVPMPRRIYLGKESGDSVTTWTRTSRVIAQPGKLRTSSLNGLLGVRA